MKRQFDKVDCSRGAPMGRPSSSEVTKGDRRCRLFRVRLDSGGYDDGGAYWGHGAPLWCAGDKHCVAFIRANSRKEAAELLGVTHRLIKPAY